MDSCASVLGSLLHALYMTPPFHIFLGSKEYTLLEAETPPFKALSTCRSIKFALVCCSPCSFFLGLECVPLFCIINNRNGPFLIHVNAMVNGKNVLSAEALEKMKLLRKEYCITQLTKKWHCCVPSIHRLCSNYVEQQEKIFPIICRLF